VGWTNTGVPFSTNTYAIITGPGGEGANQITGLLGVDDENDQFNAINNHGQIAGNSLVDGFVTDGTTEGTTSLGPLAGNGSSSAIAINEKGQVAGWTYGGDAGFVYHPFITNASHTELTDLGTLGGSGGQALGINDAGQAVGWADTADANRHAFVTGADGAGAVDLNSLVNLPKGIVLTEATGINNHGQVIAVGIIPEPQTYMMLMAGLALIFFMGRGRKEKQSAVPY
jgi:probable HAF family extracellular repeat protein